ncbi:MAG TPA: ribonuclease Z [Blastocatellia bacterium]|nr:ribonuclease Z [Blastocatellia bacterium]
MRVIPLGTSSGKPTLRRNVSALAVAREAEWLLFDCGEGAQVQIARAGLSPSRLSAVFITHLHGDHFNGLPGLLSTMGLDRRTRNLSLTGPTGIRDYLDLLERLRVVFFTYPIDLSEFNSVPNLTVVFDTSEYTVSALALDHRLFALGYRIDERPKPGRFNVDKARSLGVPEGPLWGRLQSGESVSLHDGKVVHSLDVVGPPRPGKSIAYCLDTRPCPMSVLLARDVDLLIHEATYTEEFAVEAQTYGHSTAAQAARTARDAGAHRLLITHFSSRYPDSSPLLQEARAVFPDTIVAEDLVEIEI